MDFVFECLSPVVLEGSLFHEGFDRHESVLFLVMCQIDTGEVSLANFLDRSVVLVEVLLLDFLNKEVLPHVMIEPIFLQKSVLLRIIEPDSHTLLFLVDDFEDCF